MKNNIRYCLYAVVVFALIGLSPARSDTPNDYSASFGFEQPGAWHSVSRRLLEVSKTHPEYLWCNHMSVPLEQLDRGVVLTKDHVAEGQSAGLWKDHETYPTIATWQVPADWSGANTFEVSIYSALATGETVTIGVESDSAGKAYKGYYLYDFVVNWTGWKKISAPFSAFRPLDDPAGWNSVQGLYFFSKIFRHQPNPYTALTLDAIHLATQPTPAAPQATAQGDGFIYVDQYADEQRPLNGPYPETSHEAAFNGPITYQTYFRAERDLYKYFPKFNPGYPSFDPSGTAYVNAGDTIEHVDASGKWVASDIKSVLIAWGKSQGWKGLCNAGFDTGGVDPMIRFDRDGDAYLLESVRALDSAGKDIGVSTRFTLLLYSRDRTATWSVYKLPDRTASFEKLDGHNQECLDRPPVILLGDYKYFPNADQRGYILIPEKQADGSLKMPDPVVYAENCMSPGGHSGDGNVAITHHGKVTIIFGWCPWPALQTGNWRSTMPPIPDGDPRLSQEFFTELQGALLSHVSKDGVPTYVVDYDIATRTVSKPIYVGSGGAGLDPHNWPALTIDGEGYLYAILNGHHTPVNYTHTLKPDDISAWTDPAYVLEGTNLPNLSYASLNCDQTDTLITVHRSSKDVYDEHLALYHKTAGEPWSREQILVAPGKPLYGVWYQRVTLDTKRNRLFLTYFSNGDAEWYAWDMYEMYAFVWPDREKLMCMGADQSSDYNIGPVAPGLYLGDRGTVRTWGGAGAVYTPGSTELTTLVSSDEGHTWRLAITRDFLP